MNFAAAAEALLVIINELDMEVPNLEIFPDRRRTVSAASYVTRRDDLLAIVNHLQNMADIQN